jgi:CheY-like chemotaxis protein
MLVEDDPMIAEIYVKKFESAGFEVVNAVTGKEALKYAGEQMFDLVLLDMVIPEISGMEVLKELKQSGNYTPGLKVIVFSNLSETETQKEALENGADGFIGKTEYSPAEIVEEVQRRLNEFAEQKKNQTKNAAADFAIGEKKKILLIEDEEIFLEMFGKKLEDDGYAVTYAKNGAWGVKEAAEEQFDLIITDMVMPAMGGLEIVEKFKQDEATKNTPIIVLSASVSDDIEKTVRELGVSDFLLKTRIVPSDLSRRVGELLK